MQATALAQYFVPLMFAGLFVFLLSGIPVAFGVITANSLEQAIERAGSKAGNKGWDAAAAAVETVKVLKEAMP